MASLYLSAIRLIRKIPGLRAALWRTRASFYALQRHILIGRPVIDGGTLIEKAIVEKIPFATGKMGSVEAAALRLFMKRQKAQAQSRQPTPYPPYILHTLHVNAGVFPQSEAIFDRFGDIYLEAVKQCDALVAWDVAGESEIFRAHCPATSFIKLRSLEPYFSPNPWSHAFEGKRVLVISPFVDSIQQQYAKRAHLWDDPGVLPAFDLVTLRAPFSAGLVAPQTSDWFAALEKLKTDMDALAYDVALIGAGAFSLPLAAHAKARGKVGIHMGGSLQILFGIIGKRWRENKDFKDFIKPSWRSPSAHETPAKTNLIEDGCYW